MNTSGLMGLLMRQSGRVRQASSNDRDPARGRTLAGARPAEARQKRILLEPGEVHEMARISGPGTVSRIWMTALPLTARVLRGLTLRFYWDGEQKPSVEAPFGDFFGAPFGRYVPYLAEPMGLTAGGFISYWPMPFSEGARLEVANESGRTVDPFYYQVTYAALEDRPQTRLRFHARWRREQRTSAGRPYQVLKTRGRGHYVGCHLFLQTREWWLRTPWRGLIFPRAFGLGMLEGKASIFIDGEQEPSIRGTGTEDDFGGGLYFLPGGTFSGPYHGLTVRDYWRGRFALYRFDINSPIAFEQSIEVTTDHGIQNERFADYASVAYWYQEEPHSGTSSIGRSGRAVSPGGKNMAQMAIVLGGPLLLIGVIYTILRRIIKR
ncbi:MAG: glycoside hydrolase family 172 protein [Anaerolineales bacterium]|nr:glycoside hydrolase family 172 protein [Anaerolineales bacterium]